MLPPGFAVGVLIGGCHSARFQPHYGGSLANRTRKEIKLAAALAGQEVMHQLRARLASEQERREKLEERLRSRGYGGGAGNVLGDDGA
jgi:hypothetical protein